MGPFEQPYDPNKQCFTYCGDEHCNCAAGPMARFHEQPGKLCLAYCGDQQCDCSIGPMGNRLYCQMNPDLLPVMSCEAVEKLMQHLRVNQETLAEIARLKVEYGVKTNTEVLMEHLRRHRGER